MLNGKLDGKKLAFTNFIEFNSVFNIEAARSCSTQFGEMRTDADLASDVFGQSADVRSGRTRYSKADSGSCAEFGVEDLEFADRHFDRLALDLDSFPCKLVQFLTFHFFGGIHGRCLFDSSAKLLQNGLPIDGMKLVLYLFIPQAAIRRPHSSVIARIRFKTELHDGLILFLVLVEKLREPGRLADNDNHHPRRERIESAGMADAFCL